METANNAGKRDPHHSRNMMHRRIAVFTGNRAEYGLLFPVLKAISIHPALDYRLVVAGAHLDPNFGRTVAEIEADGFVVHAQAAINLDGDTLLATAKAIGSGICLVADMLARLEPDLFVVYADRFEGIFCAHRCYANGYSDRTYRRWRCYRGWCTG